MGVGVSVGRKVSSGVGVIARVGGTLVVGTRVGMDRGVDVGVTGVAVGAAGVAVGKSGSDCIHTASNETRFSPLVRSCAIARRKIVALVERAAKTIVISGMLSADCPLK